MVRGSCSDDGIVLSKKEPCVCDEWPGFKDGLLRGFLYLLVAPYVRTIDLCDSKVMRGAGNETTIKMNGHNFQIGGNNNVRKANGA